jgi:hypothetical protein
MSEEQKEVTSPAKLVKEITTDAKELAKLAKKKKPSMKAKSKKAAKKSAKPVKKKPAKKTVKKMVAKSSKSPKKVKVSKSSVIHKSLLKPEKPHRFVMNFKVDEDEARLIRKVAQKYTRGNVTALIRLAVPAFQPRKSDLVSIRPSTRK